jgi:hypothetical protein
MAKKSAKGIKVGSRVAWQTPYTRYEAVVTEDRGNLGVNGRRIWRVRTLATYPDPRLDLELPEAELELLEDSQALPTDAGSENGGVRVGSLVYYQKQGWVQQGEVVHDYGKDRRSGLHHLVIQPLDDPHDEPFVWPAEELLPGY